MQDFALFTLNQQGVPVSGHVTPCAPPGISSLFARWAYAVQRACRRNCPPVAFTPVIILLLIGCNPFRASEVLYKRDALYNFLEEGFLSDDILQTVGTANYRSNDARMTEIRERCLERARDMALDRMVSIMLHTRLGRINRSAANQNTRGDFRQDYPHTFTDRDILLGSMDFADLLQQHFVAFQDFSAPDHCMITIRILEPGLSKKIRAHRLSFQPGP